MIKQRVVIVLGMHRGGTSVFMRGLKELGVELGEHLGQPGADNPKGFWEHEGIVALNDKILTTLGMKWHSVRRIQPEALLSSGFDPLRQQAVELVREHFGRFPLWGFKDPRTARLLPFWKRILGDLLLEASYAIVVRNPVSVARSLYTRNGFAEEKSYFLWLGHMLPALKETRGQRCVVLDYDCFMGAPEAELHRVANALHLNMNEKKEKGIKEYSIDFVDVHLRHTTFNEADSFQGEGASLLAGRVYQWLKRLAEDKVDAKDETFWSALWECERDFDAFSSLFAYLDALDDAVNLSYDKEIGRLRAVVDRSSRDLKHLSEELGKRDKEIIHLGEKLRELQHHITWTEALLDKERYTVIKPFLRRMYRQIVQLSYRLPRPVQKAMRWMKNRVYPHKVNLRLPHRHTFVYSSRADVNGGTNEADFQNMKYLPRLLAKDSDVCDVIFFPVIDWAFRTQRPQHLATELARLGHRVFYFTTTFSESKKDSGFSILEEPQERIFICQLSIPKPHANIYQDVPNKKRKKFLVQALYGLWKTCKIDQAVSILDLPFWRQIAEAMPGNMIIYDCMDYHRGFSTNSDRMLQEEDSLFREADLVVTTSKRLSEQIAEKAVSALIRNAADVDFLSQRPEQLHLDSVRPTVGYIGAISEWFDMELVMKAADEYPTWDFVLIGSTHLCNISKAKKLNNIKFVGEVPYREVPGYLHAFDVCIIPFKLTELTLSTNPVKIYEYLAAGKATVATAIPELQLISEYLHVANDSEDFVRKLKFAMEESDNQELKVHRSEWARQHNWAARANMLEEHISKLYPLVSVIVLTYNKLELTKVCLDGLREFSNYPNWELIIVDNGSFDETPDFLREYALNQRNVQIIINDENLGFAAGNNIGMKAARGDYLIMLNNDTYVTEGWMTDLLRPLRKQKDIGLVGPVTNNIGNEAKIDIEYSNMEEMAIAARRYTSAHSREFMYVNTLGFFCVALPREVFEEVGPLDEDFDVGFFEDDDYCRRVQVAGYKVAVAEDVFVHHHLSASFDEMAEHTRKKLFEKNKAKYEKKWGTWVPHKYRS